MRGEESRCVAHWAANMGDVRGRRCVVTVKVVNLCKIR